MPSDRMSARFFCTDANNLINVKNSNFTIANFTGAARAYNGADNHIDHIIIGENIQLQSGDVIIVESTPPISDRLPLLQPKSFYVL